MASQLFGSIGDMSSSNSSGEVRDDEFDEDKEGGDYQEPPVTTKIRPTVISDEINIGIIEQCSRMLTLDDYTNNELKYLPVMSMIDVHSQWKALLAAVKSDFANTIDLPAVADVHLQFLARVILTYKKEITKYYAAHQIVSYAAQRNLVQQSHSDYLVE